MAGSHRLETRRVLGGNGRRGLRQLVLVGAALLGLATLGPSQEPEDPPTRRDPNFVRILQAEWRDLVSAYEAADPGSKEEAVKALHAWYADRAGQVERAGLTLGYDAVALAQNPDWTSDVGRQVELWMDMVAALEAMGADDAALGTAVTPAGLLEDAGEFSKAAELMTDVLRRFPVESVYRANHLVRLAEMHRREGAYGKALERLDELEALDPALVDEALHVRSLLVRGMTYANLGVPDRATPYVREGARLAEERFAEGTSPPNEVLTARRMLILLAKARADPEGVVRTIDGYLEDPLYEGHPDERNRLQVFLGTSLLILSALDPARAARGIAVLEQAIELDLPLEFEGYGRLALATLAVEERRWADAREQLAAVRELLEAAGSRGGMAQISADAATLEARMALDRDAPREELEALVEPLIEAVGDLIGVWTQVPERSGGVGFLLYDQRRTALVERIRLAFALDPVHGAETGLSYVLQIQALGTLSRRESLPAPTLEEVRSKLLRDDRHGMLVFMPADPRSFVFAVDRHAVVLAELARGSEIETSRLAYLTHLLASTGEADTDGSLAREERKRAKTLAADVLPDALVDRVRGWTRITITGSDVLGPLPFEWLPLGDEPYLGVERAISYLPSIPLGVGRSTEFRSESAWDLLLMAATRPPGEVRERWPEVVDLPFTGDDEQRLLHAYRSRSRVLIGPDATFSNLFRLDPGRARVLQFLGHSVRDVSRERPIALVAASDPTNDGLLWCETVEDLTAPELVLLTACRSGAGTQRRGDPGTTDMGGAWIARGAGAVVVSSAELSYRYAVSASDTIHERLAAGDSPAEALRIVRKKLVEENPVGAPLRDGLLHVVGLGHRRVFDPGGDRDEPAVGGLPARTVAIVAGLFFVLGALVGFRVQSRRAAS